MKYLLDTNICIIYLKGKNSNLQLKLNATPAEELAVCSVVKAELSFGAMKSTYPERNFRLQQAFLEQFISLPFDDLAAFTFGIVRAELESKGTPIGAYDVQIAAIALANNLTLITHNVREFNRVSNLRLEDWEAD
ncbi:type II toxin-antitoxin system tRNA(fMet)-specific endonuclease VapC [Gloeobacter kilaueensis]|uniref:Ribonuclease VapC n=1 Tax=Gloeobacter kilaueensis (strain ATCC BAA-2537 / CCAP 1431/1 / ULC 316 / JS1) TaxID=1183438 RepID=U5QF43_GLOK1|nr:type II toxin-antitoxin system VapC family toxin [Gloeobacter kilaueensis]AGY57546.1 PilT protein domain protein [Gloeobacter kilaueensis JS1]